MLTDAKCRQAKAKGVGYRLTDGGGLHLFVTPAGGRHWRLRYEFEGKEKLLSLGPYPDIGLIEARQARMDAKAALRRGRDPAAERKRMQAEAADAAALTFERVAREWHAASRPTWTPTHAADVLHSLERDIFPKLGGRPIAAIAPADVLTALRKIEARPAIETAHRVRQRMSAVFVYGIATGACAGDPAAVVKNALRPVPRKRRRPAMIDIVAAREMLAAVERTPGHPVTRLACRLLALTVTRPGELRHTPWTEWTGLDPDAPLWRIPAARRKLMAENKDDPLLDHWVPLSRQAVEIIDALRPLTGRSPYAFPGARNAHQPMSENAIGYMLNRAGYHGRHVPHGFRASFSTIMNEMFRADRQIIDLMLAHVPKDRVEGAYNRAAHMERRRELAQQWADLLLEGAAPLADILEIRRR